MSLVFAIPSETEFVPPPPDTDPEEKLSQQVLEAKRKLETLLLLTQEQLSSSEEFERRIVVTTSVQGSVVRSREHEVQRLEEKIASLEIVLIAAEKENQHAREETREQREKAAHLRCDVSSRMVALSNGFSVTHGMPLGLDAVGWDDVLATYGDSSATAPPQKRISGMDHDGVGDRRSSGSVGSSEPVACIVQPHKPMSSADTASAAAAGLAMQHRYAASAARAMRM